MYPGRQPGSRTIQGLTLKAEFGKLCLNAESEQGRHTRCADLNWLIKTIQNLTITILITIASSAAFLLVMGSDRIPAKWAVVCLSVTAPLCTLVFVSRRYSERHVAHFQIARRYSALATSCRLSITKYEEALIGDIELQALLDRHFLDMDDLKRESNRIEPERFSAA